ncbi:MAG: NAD(P)/FAD-dependent oxidoreductase [Brachymonas sp.]|nr:NAD(P)/FAD-dependent oxidoreductase [Brachymonas sp.]
MRSFVQHIPFHNGTPPEALIIGAGPAGLAVAVSLQKKGIASRLLEASNHVGNSWRNHYERLHLHTPKSYSALPGMEWPHDAPRYPKREQVVEYLQRYADAFGIRPQFDQRVHSAKYQDGAWQVQAQDSRGYISLHRAPMLVVASGYSAKPNLPQWEGQSVYGGQLMHSSRYFSGSGFRGQRVLVVGMGNSGGEIALDLAEHGVDTTLSVRGPVNVIPKEVLGVSYIDIARLQRYWPAWLADAFNAPTTRLLIGDLQKHGLRKSINGPVREIRSGGRVPLIDIGTLARIRSGDIAMRPAIQRFTATGVVFDDGRTEPFDTVVLATGYRPNVRDWLQLPPGTREDEVWNADGVPLFNGQPVAVPQLYFCGFYVASTGMLHEIAREARRIAHHMAETATSLQPVQPV